LPVAPCETASAPSFSAISDLLLRDQRPRDRGAEADTAPHRPHWRGTSKYVVADEFLAHILDEMFLRLECRAAALSARRFKLLALAEIGVKVMTSAP